MRGQGLLQNALGRERFGESGEQLLAHPEHVLLFDERHLEVELRELGLAIGALVLVSETARDLEVAVDARHHAQLLELLRALRQRIEAAGVQSTRHQVVARSLGRRVGQNRRLDFEKALAVEEVADVLDDLDGAAPGCRAMRGRRRSI